jgi:hypothetical protein
MNYIEILLNYFIIEIIEVIFLLCLILTPFVIINNIGLVIQNFILFITNYFNYIVLLIAILWVLN